MSDHARSGTKRIWITAWMVTAVFILSNSATPLYIQWQGQMGFTNGTLTLIFAAYIIGLLATLLVAGQLSDRFGRKPVLFPGLSAALVACVMFASASSVIMLVIARLLSGVAVGVIVTAGMASVVDAGGPSKKYLSSLAASVAMVLGAGLGPLLAGIMAQELAKPAVPIFIMEFIILVTAFIVASSLPRHQNRERLEDPSSKWRLRLPGVDTPNRTHLALGIAVFAPGITSTSFVLSLGPSLLSKLIHVTSPLVAGGTACAMFLAATGVQFGVKKLAIRQILFLGSLAVLLSMVSMAAAVNLSVASLLVIAAVFAGMGQGLGQLGGLTLISLHVPEFRRAEANAVLNLGGYIPAALLPVGTGFLIDSTSLAFGATLFTVVLIAASIVGACFVAARLKQEH
ncbi:Predicted arabinose efflux permease, MFS family [Paenibacillus tianmuensis]|uniref:Predicted arabinose efflux permease, MFS family n=1 Tax=Paenibacillus tianmuensis TaxID=624147 RepID=A0A1G4SI69_9BACL|nr:MFS transporter [Paenibacillus tianmuensis]SCW68758.1 Predicted arabinose efflux permease, MFS family [Paenibacillus tianmuensis]